MSDIKFDGNWVIVEGNWTKLQTLDLMLDSSSRRKSSTGLRRALVHDLNDGLTINWGSDYPGGVTIKGSVVVDSLFVKGNAGFASGIHTPKISIGQPSTPSTGTSGVPPGSSFTGLDLVAAIKEMEEEIKELKDKVAKLEGGA